MPQVLTRLPRAGCSGGARALSRKRGFEGIPTFGWRADTYRRYLEYSSAAGRETKDVEAAPFLQGRPSGTSQPALTTRHVRWLPDARPTCRSERLLTSATASLCSAVMFHPRRALRRKCPGRARPGGRDYPHLLRAHRAEDRGRGFTRLHGVLRGQSVGSGDANGRGSPRLGDVRATVSVEVESLQEWDSNASVRSSTSSWSTNTDHALRSLMWEQPGSSGSTGPQR